MNILEEIAQKTRERIEKQKERKPMDVIEKEARAMDANTGFPFEKALKKSGISFICEVKKASPSKGVIAQEFPYVEIGKRYEKAGASAISVLTEPYYFQGSDDYLKEIKEAVTIPILRKDFTIDPYMIHEAKIMGASAVLLICALLSQETLKEYIEIAHSLGLSALVEAHDAEEVEKGLKAGARVLGVNNRDLKTFTVNIKNSITLRKQVPKEVLFVSESGIKTKEDIGELAKNHVDGVLVGETMMRAGNVSQVLGEMIAAGKENAR